jgi:arylsulfatase A-like enzyme
VTRRVGAVLVAMALGVTALACSGGDEGATGDAEQGPNIVVVLADDLALTDIADMPHLQGLLVDGGLSFDRFYVSNAFCCPSRVTALRGQYAHNTRVLTNQGPTGGFETARRVGIERSTLATWLQDAGYRTGLVGKYLNEYPTGAGPTYIPPGWDEWTSVVDGNTNLGFDYTLNVNGQLVSFGSDREDYATDVYFDEATSFVAAASEDEAPFFLWLAPDAPHLPAVPAPEDAGLFADRRVPRTAAYNQADTSASVTWQRVFAPLSVEERDRFDEQYRNRLRTLQSLDRGLARLVDALEEAGTLDDTYLLFTSDNGFHLGLHRLPPGKETAFEEDIHVPLLVRGPGVPTGERSDAFVANIDLAPTLAGLAGAEVPDEVDGRSFGPVLDDPGAGDDRQSLLLEHWSSPLLPSAPGMVASDDGDVAVDQVAPDGAILDPVTGDPLVFLPPQDFRGLRTGRYTYLEYVTGEVELYDNVEDPDQIHNLAATADRALLDELSQRLDDLRSCAAESCRRSEDAAVPE